MRHDANYEILSVGDLVIINGYPGLVTKFSVVPKRRYNTDNTSVLYATRQVRYDVTLAQYMPTGKMTARTSTLKYTSKLLKVNEGVLRNLYDQVGATYILEAKTKLMAELALVKDNG